MKYAANIISISRIILSVILFFSFHNPWLFFVIYLICGASDVLDGYIARKTKTQSTLGARLDSIADLILFILITLSVVLWLGSRVVKYIPLIGLVIVIRLVNIVIAACKYHTFATLHTWGNKITGFLVFLTPLIILLRIDALLWLVGIAAVLSALEESIIHLTAAELDLNRQSIFKAK